MADADKFYLLKTEELTGDDRIKQFVREYNQIYYTGGFGCSCNSKYVETVIEQLLWGDIRSERDVLRIIAWKMGKIHHSDIEQAFKNETGKEDPSEDDYNSVSGNVRFIYTEDWKDAEKLEPYNDTGVSIDELKLMRWGKTVQIACLVHYIVGNKDNVRKKAEDHPEDVLCELLDTKPTQIGTVGIINLLYFLSKGKYPIYDQFADRALTAIIEGKKPGDSVSVTTKLPDKSSSKFAKNLMDPDGGYMQYRSRIEHVFGDYEQNYRWNRDIDRALWVYGHQFSTGTGTGARC